MQPPRSLQVAVFLYPKKAPHMWSLFHFRYLLLVLQALDRYHVVVVT